VNIGMVSHKLTSFVIAIILYGVMIIVSNLFLTAHYANAVTAATPIPINHTSPTNSSTPIRPISPNPWISVSSFLISVAIVSGIFIFVAYCLKGKNMAFGDIIRDGSGFPSLARFQFLLWTFIIMFAVLSVYFIRLFMGTPQLPNELPTNLLILTGISVAVPFVSNPISTAKYGGTKPASGTLKEGDRRRLATMLMENEKPTVSRFQMFAWTIISIIIYLGFFFSKTTFLLGDVNTLSVPDIPQIFVVLMGLSQTAYVGNKATVTSLVTVLRVSPNQAVANADVQIVGANFGKQTDGSVMFEDGPPETTGNQITVQTVDIKDWQENKIQIKVPSLGLTPGTTYYVRVSSAGVISYKSGGLLQLPPAAATSNQFTMQ
jgi:hypothetical protein